MRLNPDYRPDFESLKQLLLEMAQERSGRSLLKLIVSRLAKRPPLALAQVWLIKPGDECPSCPAGDSCSEGEGCLHLAASAGRSVDGQGTEWSQPPDGVSRLPLGEGPVGRIGSSGKPEETPDVTNEYVAFMQPKWVAKAGVVGFVGQPLINRGKVLGVLALYTRMRPLPEGIIWARMIADHAASAIANTRAFEEIEHLRRRLELENEYLREEVSEARAFGDIIGRSPAMQSVIQQIDQVAPTDASVLVLGESGTGKELVSREIYKRSRRQEEAMIKINCASIPRELYESEFFGHVRGAFTGAIRDRAGRFAAADGGTLFLDEVGEIPLQLQGKLLRVLQDGRYERVGEELTRRVDVRIIAATNRDLGQDIQTGRFRQDLYYRLNVFPLEIPPLRQRKEDIPLLAARFLSESRRKMHRPELNLGSAEMEELMAYDWPGNVRELQNVIERAVITSQDRRLSLDLPGGSGGGQGKSGSVPAGPADRPARVVPESEMRRLIKDNIRTALNRCQGKVYGPGGAAELLEIKPTTLAARIRKFGLRP